ncbi:MAG: pyridoxamine 5'-phosphate oxidase family protein [Bacilli bacterium]
MANIVENTLVPVILETLQEEPFVVVNTLDHENGNVNSNAISWIVALTAQKLQMAVDQKSRIVENVRSNGKCTLFLTAGESAYSVVVNAQVSSELIQGVPLKLAMIVMEVQEVREVLYYGVKIIQTIQCEKTYDKEAAARLDQQVYTALGRS